MCPSLGSLWPTRENTFFLVKTHNLTLQFVKPCSQEGEEQVCVVGCRCFNANSTYSSQRQTKKSVNCQNKKGFYSFECLYVLLGVKEASDTTVLKNLRLQLLQQWGVFNRTGAWRHDPHLHWRHEPHLFLGLGIGLSLRVSKIPDDNGQTNQFLVLVFICEWNILVIHI